MLAFEVFLNRRKVALAGTDDLGVLGTIISATGVLGPKAASSKCHPKGYSILLDVGGLTRRKKEELDEHVRWIEVKRLKVGDEILVRVRKVRRADPPTNTFLPSQKMSEKAAREEFKWVKARYLKLRKKYEKPRDR